MTKKILQEQEVVLGGRTWLVPALTARQNKVIDPLIIRLLPVFSGWQQDRIAALAKLGSEEYEMLQEIAFQAINSQTAGLTREAFLELPVTLPELVAAFAIIAEQTGIFARGGGEPGEV